MNTAELESMQAAIRTMADAVEDLSRMCEGLPKFLETKIGEFRAEMNVTVDGLHRKLMEHGDSTTAAITTLHAQQLELDGKLKVFQDSLTVTVETTASETRQIIADNRREIEGMIEASAGGLLEKIASVDTLSAERSMTLSADIKGVREACDTTDLHHGLATVKTAVEKNEKLIDAVTVRMDEQSNMQGEFRSMHATLAGEVRQIGSDLAAVPEQIAAAVAPVPEQIAAAVAQTEAVRAAQHAELAGALRGEIEALAGRADELQKQIVLAENGLSKMIASAEERGTTAFQAAVSRQDETESVLSARIERGETTLAEFAGSIDSLRSGMVAFTARLDDANERAVNLVRAIEDTFTTRMVASEDDLTRHAQELARITEASAVVSAEIETIGANFAELRSALGAQASRIGEVEAKVTDEASARTKALEEHGATLRGTLWGAFRPIAEQVKGLPAVMDEKVAVMDEKVAGLGVQIEKINGYVKTLQDGVFELGVGAKGTEDALESLRSMAVAANEKAVEGVAGVEALHESLTEIQAAVRAVETATGEIKVLQTQGAETAEAVEMLRGLVISVEGKLAGAVETLNGERTTASENLRHQIEEVRQFAQSAVSKAVEGLLHAADADKVLEEVRREHTGQWTGAIAAIEEVRTNVSALEKAWPAAIEEMRARVDAIKIPEPVAPVELQAIEVQPPPAEFQLAYEDGNLVVALEYKDNDEVKRRVATTIPLQIGVFYRGVYKADQQYPAGHMVSHKGSVWISRGTATGEPGKDFTGWQLAVKRGADGKDAVPVRTYTAHDPRNVYRESDFLRLNNRLWQCAVKETRSVPEPGDITSTPEWLLIGGVQ